MVAVIFHRLGHYHVARLKRASQSMRLLAIELSEETSEYQWDKRKGELGFERVTVFPGGDSRQHRSSEVARRVWAALDEHRPRAVAIPGWWEIGAVAALTWCLKRQTPGVLMSDSSEVGRHRRGVKEWCKRQVVPLYSAALVAGTPQTAYVVRLGMPRESCFTGYNVVDNDSFARSAHEARARGAAGKPSFLPDNYFLVVARFIDEKNFPGLIEAYATYRRMACGTGAEPAPWHLVLVGDGPLRPVIEGLVRQHSLGGSVHLSGFKQYNDLPIFYAFAGALILPSVSETWGLVVNEAMASGLPVLVSSHCGCARDLVAEGRNGFTFNPRNPRELADRMLRFSSGQEDLAAMGRASREIIGHWPLEAFSRGLAQAVEKACGLPQKKAGLLRRCISNALMLR